MLIKLLTDEENRQMTLLDAMAIEVNPENISSVIEEDKNIILPEYLKKVKRFGNTFLVLKSIGLNPIPNGIQVKIPEFKPVTKEKYEFAKLHWPCHYYNILMSL